MSNQPGYGGSDSTALSFNRTQYAGNASLHEPIQLSSLAYGPARVSGIAGGESGRSTVFYRFDLDEESIISIRFIGLENWKTRSVSVALMDAEGDSIALEDGLSRFLRQRWLDRGITPISTIVDGRYVEDDADYWGLSYVFVSVTTTVSYLEFSDDGEAPQSVAFILDPNYLNTGAQVLIGYAIDDPAPWSDLEETGRMGAMLPAGSYLLGVKNDDWRQARYSVEMGIIGSKIIDGEIGSRSPHEARLSTVNLGGEIIGQLVPSSRLQEEPALEGLADFSAASQGLVEVFQRFG